MILVISKLKLSNFHDFIFDILMFLPLQKIETNVGEEIDREEIPGSSKKYQYFDSVRKNGVLYKIGDACYMDPGAFNFTIKPEKPNKPPKFDKNVS